MNEWGVPDWRSADGYERKNWNINQWRWQFIRRRADLRAEFDRLAQRVYADKLELFEAEPDLFPDGIVLRPSDPGFTVATRLIHGGHEHLPNPRISEQPFQAISWNDRSDAWRRPVGDEQDGFLRFEFDLSRPLAPQLKTAERFLKEFQRLRVGKLVQFRQHREKWPTYLRVLDARNEGASWSEIAPILRFTTGTDQNARDVHQQAEDLCFNFPI